MILNNEKYNWDILDTNQASNKKFMEDLEAFNLEDFLVTITLKLISYYHQGLINFREAFL